MANSDPDSWNAEDRALSSSSNATATKLHAFSTANSMTALSCTSTQNSYTRGSHHRSYGADTLKSPYLRVSAGYLGTSAPIHHTMPACATELYASASNVPNHPLEIQPRSSFQQHSRRGPAHLPPSPSEQDTIYALATPPGRGGIGVIHISARHKHVPDTLQFIFLSSLVQASTACAFTGGIQCITSP
ncbi:hypothetical protein BS47DRAFT_1387625 [Hydnum rufescens UP504]|uniref:Uncharacterized protein n=1 Tax=Hydnum rufescens UP504 TaxID=1448309 RepID=A0A9P6B945_9AGAM|nr:hypothetical protein BS47DRAFT_1387625 [Hydnum rufescens UP504]